MSSDKSPISALLDAAKARHGSDYKTAQMLDVKPSRIWEWRNGRVNPQPEDFALVAAIAGLDPEEHLIRAVLAKHADTPKGERLLSALGKGLQAIGAAATLAISVSIGFGASTTEARANALPSPEGQSAPSVYYVNLLTGLLRWLRKLGRQVERVSEAAQPS